MGRCVWWVPLLLLCAGCTFNSDWKRIARSSSPTNSIAGAWIGEWKSNRNGHHGQLRCIMTPHSPTAYMARYRARFWKIFAASYTVPLSVTNINGTYMFAGNSDLGWLGGGVYTYEGFATPTVLASSYKSKYDHGTFSLRRPEPKN